MTKILIDRAVVEQALEALEWHYRQGHSNTLGGLRLKIDEKALRNLKAALAEPEPCRYPDCVDNGPDGKCTRWLLAECSKSEVYKPQRPAEPQEHLLQQALEALLMMRDRYSEANCPACAHADAAVYALKAALAEEALQRLTDVQQDIEAALAAPEYPLGQASTDVGVPVYVLKKAEPVEPVAWMVYTDEDGKSVCVIDHPADFVQWRSFPLYTSPPQRKPLTEGDLRKLADKHLFHQPESYEASGVFALSRAAIAKAEGQA